MGKGDKTGAADRKVQQLLQQWGLSEEDNAEAVAQAYERE